MSLPLQPVHAIYSNPNPAFNPSQKRETNPPPPPPPDHSQRPAKRARKAINCEPCRASKLKCDRGRPCSGCVLRGTVASCYADSPLHPGDDSSGNPNGRDDYGPINPRIDPRAEITRIRNSLLVIEQHINRTAPISNPNSNSASTAASFNAYDSRRSSLAPTQGSGNTVSVGLSETDFVSASIGTSNASLAASSGVTLPAEPPPRPGDDGSFIGATSLTGALMSLSIRDRARPNGLSNATTTSNPDYDNLHNELGLPTSSLASSSTLSPTPHLPHATFNPASYYAPSPSPPLEMDDLINALPDMAEIDELLAYYFSEFSQDALRVCGSYVHRTTFSKAWEQFKTAGRVGGESADRLNAMGQLMLLSLVFGMMAVAVRCLPPTQPNDPSTSSMSSGHVELSKQYFSLAEVAYQRAQPPNSSSSRPMLSLDVIEYLLIKFHYLTLRLEAGEINGSGTTDIERIWKVRGILVSMAVAMGLHRDPAQWKKFGKEERDRRRWAWWNILGVDRWQSLLLGRPLSVANHSFDTSHPSGTLSSASSQSPSAPSSQASPAATTTSLRLTQLMGDVIDDATSIRPVPYERIMAHDRALQSLLETLDDEGSSTKTAMAKAAVLHVRIALHRPFVTTSQSQHHTGHHGLQHQQSQQAARTKSIELAVRAAESLIHTFVQAVSVASTSPGIKPSPTPVPFSYSTQSSPVQSPIHPTLQSPYQKQQLTTLALHTFAACTVLSSILIHPPQHVGSPSSQYRHQNHHQLRQTLRAALHSLSGIKGAVPMAERSWRVLSSLRPLWDEGGERIDHARRRECWDAVTKSQFPYISGFGGAFGGFAMERRGSASSSTRSGNGSASASPPAGTTPSSSSSTSCSSSQGLGMANPSVSPATSMSSNGGSVHGVGAGDGMSMSLTTPNPVVHGIAGYSPPTHQQPTSTNSILISPYNPTPANAPGGAVLIAPPTITTTGLPPASMSTVTSPQTAHPASSAQYLAAGTEYFDMSGYATATPVDVADAWPASLGLYQNAGVAPDWAGIVDGLAGAGAMSRQGSMSSRGYLG